VDSLSKYNVIYWDKSSFTHAVDSFIVYRYDVISSNYLHIGAVPYDSLSAFADTAFSIGGPNGGNPKYSAWKYKLAVRYTCGNISAKSPYHQSIFVQANLSNFSWTAYIDSGQVNLPTGYSFKRDDNNTGSWHVLANTSSTSSTDPNYTSYPNGNWRVDALGFNCTATLINPKNPYINAISLNSSRSNVYRVNNPNSVNEISLNDLVSVSPNPSSGMFNVQMSKLENVQIKIYDVLGKCIYEQAISDKAAANSNSPNGLSLITVNLSEAKNGVYFLQLKTSEGMATKKLVISK
jgi:hypothetical protein